MLAPAFDGGAFPHSSARLLHPLVRPLCASSRNEESPRSTARSNGIPLSKANLERRLPKRDYHFSHRKTLVTPLARTSAGATSCEARTRSRYEDVTSRQRSRSTRHLTFRSLRSPTYLASRSALRPGKAMRNCGVPKKVRVQRITRLPNAPPSPPLTCSVSLLFQQDFFFRKTFSSSAHCCAFDRFARVFLSHHVEKNLVQRQARKPAIVATLTRAVKIIDFLRSVELVRDS